MMSLGSYFVQLLLCRTRGSGRTVSVRCEKQQVRSFFNSLRWSNRAFGRAQPSRKVKVQTIHKPSPPPPSLRGRRGRSKMQLLLLIIPVTTFGLGTWQIFRLQWKVDLIDALERKTKLTPVIIPTNILEQLEELEYSRVTLTGYFDHTKELHIWPRPFFSGSDSRSTSTEPGACIVTPFYCYELQDWILVNRGWVPQRKQDSGKRLQGQVAGDINLIAVVRMEEKKPMFSPENEPNKNHWCYKDVSAMATQTGTLPIFLDADYTTTIPGGPIGGQTRVYLRNDHLQYVFTWYALSLFTGYMFYVMWKKARRRM